MNILSTLSRLAATICTVAALMHAAAARAEVTLLYTGLSFNEFQIHPNSNGVYPTFDTNDRVTLSIQLASALTANLSGARFTPTAFSAGNGIHTLTDADADASESIFKFWTDAMGFISQWDIQILQHQGLADFSVISMHFDGSTPQHVDSGLDRLCGPISQPPISCVLGGFPFHSAVGKRVGEAGVWQGDGLPHTVPEPAPLVMLGFLPAFWLARRVRGIALARAAAAAQGQPRPVRG